MITIRDNLTDGIIKVKYDMYPTSVAYLELSWGGGCILQCFGSIEPGKLKKSQVWEG